MLPSSLMAVMEMRIIVRRADDPEQFRRLMGFQWLRGSLVVVAGFIFRGICCRADRVDPFSPEFFRQLGT